jgi:hypothetical protein
MGGGGGSSEAFSGGTNSVVGGGMEKRFARGTAANNSTVRITAPRAGETCPQRRQEA